MSSTSKSGSVPRSGCNALSIPSNANVEALLTPPGVVGRLRKDVPDTADADRECRVVVRDISSASSPLSYRSVRKMGVSIGKDSQLT